MGKFEFIARNAASANPYAPVSLDLQEQAQRRARTARPPRPIRARDWAVTMVVALLVALVIRAFVLEAFRIPTSSMEKSLLVGDFVLVSKLHYGPRTPVTLGIPFTNLYLRRFRLPALRVPGLSEPHHGDVIVFNYPGEDVPVDRKTHYIKRLIALPGDTLSILNKVPYVNGREMPMRDGMQQKWMAFKRPGHDFPMERLHERGVENVGTLGRLFEGVAFESTVALAREVATWDEIAAIEPFVIRRDPGIALRVFPEGSGYGPDNYGPLYVPARGDTLHLTPASWPAYADLITRFEGHTASPLPDGTFRIDGVQTDHYVVAQDYFFVMGDNRDSSYDSRIWGFVPKDHVVGKAILVYFSWDHKANRPRFDRAFSKVE